MPTRRLTESLALGQSNAFNAFCIALASYVDGESDATAFLRVVTSALAEVRMRRLPPERLLSAMVALNCRPALLVSGDTTSDRSRRYTRALDLLLTAYYEPVAGV